MNEGARQANQSDYEQSINWKLARIIELLEELVRLSPEPAPPPSDENEQKSEYLLDRVLRAMPEPSGSETTDANVELPARDDPVTYEYVRKDVEAIRCEDC